MGITHRPGAPDGTGPGRPARPVQPARPGHPRTASSSASPGREVVRGDILDPGRRRSRAGRRHPAARHQPERGRVAAHRRIGAGAQDALGRRARPRTAGRRRSALRLLRHAGHGGPGRRRGAGHGRPHRTRQDRQGAAAGRARSRRSCRRRPAGWCAPCRGRAGGLRARGRGLYASRAAARRRSGRRACWPASRMAMATLPEEFPVVLTIFLALGAWRISRSRVLTRRMPAIETLGAATVLCVDKTGTLTLNQMTAEDSWPSTAALPCVGGGRRRPARRRSTSCWSTPSWPASGTRSIRWNWPSRRRANGC